MTKIIAPNKNYNGVSASVQFKNGIGETSDDYLIDWFKKNGYEVQFEQEPTKVILPIEADVELEKSTPEVVAESTTNAVEENPKKTRKGKE